MRDQREKKILEREKEMGRTPCCDKANVKKGPWSPEEDAKLKDFIEKYGTGGNWIALPQKAGKIINYFVLFFYLPTFCFRLMGSFLNEFLVGFFFFLIFLGSGLKRCGKSCRLRWLNYLRPNIKHGDFSEEEDRIICRLFSQIRTKYVLLISMN